MNRLQTMSTSFAELVTYNYDDVGNLKGTQVGGLFSTGYTYDPLNRLTNMQSTCGASGCVSSCGTAAPGCAIASYTYTLGAAGNRLSVAELSGRTVQYGYDDLYRLTSETISGATAQNGTVGYQYDSVGNRVQLSSTLPAVPASGLLNYDANDRTSTDVYDANGNTTFNGQQNVYDFENHLVQRGGVSIVYDGDGNRVQETVAGVTTKYLVGEVNPTGYVQVFAELNGTNNLLRGYEWGLELEAVRDFTVNSFGTFHYYGHDGHGSVRWLTNSSGVISDTYDYDAFGNLISSTGTTFNNYLFAGEQFDPALGVYYNRARYYDQRQGRFWTADTFEGDPDSPISLHAYLYAFENPVGRIDPTGNESLAEAEESIADQLTIASRTTLQVLRLYNKTKTILEFINMARELVSVWHSGGLENEVKNLIKSARSDWKGLTTEAVTDDLESNLPRIIEEVVFWWPAKLAAEHGRPPDAFGIDLPVPLPMPKLALPIGKIPDTSFKGYVIFGAGGTRWGRVTGLEVQYSGAWEQIWRMDFHGAHEETGKDLDQWGSTFFHYHILD